MAAVGHLSSAIGDNNPMSLMMKMTNMRPEPPQRHDDVSSTSPDTSLENDDVTNRNHGDEYESDVDVMNDGGMEQKREEAEVKMECDQDDDMSSPMNPHHHRGSSRSESSSRESPVSLHGAPAKHAGTPPVTKATDFSIDKILRSDFGPKSSEKPTTPPTRHQKFDFSMEALAAHCWNSSSTKDKPTGVVLETSFGEHCYTSPLMDYRRTIPSPTLSVSVSPSSTSSPTLSPNGHVHSSPTSSTDHDSSSPSTSPRRHYPAPPGMGASLPTKHPRVVPPAYPTITPYPCNPALLKTLHHQNQQRNNYLQHLITTAQAATHELMTSHSAAAAAAVHYAASPYTAAVVDKLSGAAAAAAAAAASSAIGLPTTRDLHSHHRSNRHHNNNSNNHSRPDSCTQQPVTSQRSPSHDQRSPITSQKHVPSISVSRGMGSESACSGVSGAGQSAAACRKESEHGAPKPALQQTAGRPAGDSTNKPAADGGEMKTQEASAAPGAEAAGEKKVLWPAWVYCTRYSDRPSSGPRSRKNKKKKDPKPPGNLQPSNGGAGAVGEEKRPRTAFTNEQLSRLRREFDENRYLTEERRQNLAKDLQLNESQIKIWFQNKRAKIKKSTGTRNALALQLMAQGLYNHATVDSSGEQPQNASSTAAPTSR